MTRGLVLLFSVVALVALAPRGEAGPGSQLLLLAAVVLLGFELSSYASAETHDEVPLQARLLASSAGMLGVGAMALVVHFLVGQWRDPYYPELRVWSLAAIPGEALVVSLASGLAALLLPRTRWAADARDPISALLGWAAPTTAATAMWWGAVKSGWTHVGELGGWGRCLLLGLAFGAGWSAAASRLVGPPQPAAPPVPARWPHATTLYAVIVALSPPVVSLLGSWWLFRYRFLCGAAPLVWVGLGWVVAGFRAPRSRSPAAELARVTLLSLPFAALGLVVVDLAEGLVLGHRDALALLVIPAQWAMFGTVWFVGVGALLAVRRP